MAKKKSKTDGRSKRAPQTPFTATQGQYLAYIHLYWKLNRRGPAESEIARYFRVSAPSAHQMIVKLEEKGLITREPGVPRSVRIAVPRSELPELADEEEETATARATATRKTAGQPQLYTLAVFLVGGPMPEELEGQEISRTIEIRGDQTLKDLHEEIFDAFDRWDEHFYEFQFGSGPHDPKGPRYVLPEVFAQDKQDPSIAGDVTQTTLDSLGLKVDQSFGYCFDYGDDWWHQIDVEAIDEKVPGGKFPKVTKRVGKSPPQYDDPDADYD
jgi:hypothetical protein